MKRLSLCLLFIVPASAGNLVPFVALVPQDASQKEARIYRPEEVDRRARITKRSQPRYTEQARKNHTSGVVQLRVVLKSSGEIGEITVISGLEDGLTEQCIRAAREIKFGPAMKDGNPVSQFTRVEYTFRVE